MSKFHYLLILVILLPVSLFGQTVLSPDQIFEKVNNSVVVVLAYSKNGDVYQGSGVVLNNNGYIATNFHVCEGATRIDVKHYNQDFKNAEIYLKDESKDILILKINSKDLSPITINTSEGLKSGQRIYAIGSPEGYENSISEGIISGFRFDENNNKLIQMTAPITDGSSGGALVNSNGELIGLSVSGQHEGNLYFAIPSDDIVSLTGKDNIVMTDSVAEINYYEEGTAAKENENYREAELYFTKHLEKFSYDVKAYFNRGYSRTKLKEYTKAINDFDKAIEYNPDDADSYFYRGNCRYSLKEFDEAINDYNKAIELEPDYSDFYYNRGYARYKLKMYMEALSDWEKCIKLNPDYSGELSSKIKSVKENLNK
jgi:tetratricopeptide (TPR) repeat protein